MSRPPYQESSAAIPRRERFVVVPIAALLVILAFVLLGGAVAYEIFTTAGAPGPFLWIHR